MYANFDFRPHGQICIYAKFAIEICTWSQPHNMDRFAHLSIFICNICTRMQICPCECTLTIASTKVLFFIAVAQALWLLWELKSFHWLTMGKVKIEIYCYLIADILTKVLQKCSWSSPLQTIWILSKLLILIGCHGNRNVTFSKNIFKNLLLKSHKWGEAETLHKCLCYYPLH